TYSEWPKTSPAASQIRKRSAVQPTSPRIVCMPCRNASSVLQAPASAKTTNRTYVALFTPYLYTPSKPLEPVQNGYIFAWRVSVAEASEFMIGNVVSPLTQLIHDQADIRHGKELILCTMCDIDRQVVRLGTTLVWPEYPGYDRQASKALRPGKTHF